MSYLATTVAALVLGYLAGLLTFKRGATVVPAVRCLDQMPRLSGASDPRRSTPKVGSGVMRADHRVAVVQDALQRINSTLLDVEDELGPATGDGPSPTAWRSALDDFHTVLIELASLATVLQPDLITLDATAALARASAAITAAATAIAAAQESIKPRPANR